ncbi:MAG: ArsJ-associated glyceraldehyde-3-phosphate dehydrogenase [Actinobacteria bacterium]|jgi:glyceraldehyde 3-phosphate dehydrogenase|nr:ArsJ-associated glyceraldehyde-3-phosphate dehydrogenase [Actinomycetota bacterium]MDA2994673.1 ArsJ-associated glyceraldehyde-3-phosphate dehydrogenase [Actinomycetota bacterium]
MARVGINGFGRIGRLAARALHNHPSLELVHINELKGDAETAAHLFEFDTVHGRYEGDVSVDGDTIIIDGSDVTYSNEASPSEINWSKAGVDIVIESSGKFKSVSTLQPHLNNGATSVIVAAPVKDDSVLNVVIGCNDDLYSPSAFPIATAASCTTNSIAPVVKTLHEAIGIERGTLTTIHDVTNTQVIVDAPHKDLRRARSALNSLIPTSTGSATAVTMIVPELAGRLNGIAVRVPMLNASLTDLSVSMARNTTVDEVNSILQQAAEGPLAGVLGFETKPLVSADYVNDPRSGIVDAPSTMVVDGCFIKVLVWYDNEFGYAHRLVELVQLAADRS